MIATFDIKRGFKKSKLLEQKHLFSGILGHKIK